MKAGMCSGQDILTDRGTEREKTKAPSVTYMAVPWMDARGGMRAFLVKEALHFRAKSRNAVEVRGQCAGVDALLPPSRSWGLNSGHQA